MISRENIEKVLRLNGIEPGAQDEEIKSVLLSARFNKDEVDTAIMVLRQNVHTNRTRVDGLHKVFQTDQTLNAKEISDLLGIDVALNDHPVLAGRKARQFTMVSQILLIIISVSLALTMLLMFMYFTEVGLFHPTSAVAAKFAK